MLHQMYTTVHNCTQRSVVKRSVVFHLSLGGQEVGGVLGLELAGLELAHAPLSDWTAGRRDGLTPMWVHAVSQHRAGGTLKCHTHAQVGTSAAWPRAAGVPRWGTSL